MIWRSDYGRGRAKRCCEAGSSLGQLVNLHWAWMAFACLTPAGRLYKGERLAGMSLERHDKRSAEVERRPRGKKLGNSGTRTMKSANTGAILFLDGGEVWRKSEFQHVDRGGYRLSSHAQCVFMLLVMITSVL
jgi:hypothetical protein